MNAFFTRLWNRRLVRFGSWSLITLATLYALLFSVINWTGSRRWAETRALLAREGETLDFNKLLPPPVADPLNFCAIEPLRGINVAGDGKSPSGLKRAALESACWQRQNGSLEAPSLRDGPCFGRAANMQAWAAFARDSKYAVLPAGPAASSRDLLAAIDASHPLLKQLAEAAAARPEAVFVPIPTPSRPLCAMALPHFTTIRELSLALTLRSLAANECGDHNAACQSALAVLRLAQAAQREPTLIGELIGVAVHEIGEEAVWTALAKRQATDAELQDLQASLAKLDFHQATLTAMRGEMASAIDTMEYLQAGPYHIPDLVDVLSTDAPTTPSSRLKRLLWTLVPAGWFEHNKAAIATLEFEQCIRPLKRATAPELLRQEVVFEEDIRAHSGLLHPDRFMANLVAPAIAKVVERAFSAEALRRQALTACALERFYLLHQAYPASLAQLTPTLLPVVPADPIDDQPLRYRKTDDGRYMLWSIGLDQKDDNGKVNLDPKDKQSTSRLHHSTYKGDWTWQYQPVK